MSDDYAVLAPVYEPLGMAAFAETMTPRLMDYAQSHDWVGRRAVDLGCGTGASLRWFANHGYNISGIDVSPSMLKVAQNLMTGTGVSYQLYEGDIRALSNMHDIDLVIALDMINELNNLRDLEALFASVARTLSPNRLFIFDVHTIEGLAQRNPGGEVVVDNDDLTVFAHHHFDYDRQSSTADYVIFQRGASAWQRQRATHTVRGFPIQVVSALLQRAGFGIMALVSTRLEVLDPGSMHEPRVIYFARRLGAGTE